MVVTEITRCRVRLCSRDHILQSTSATQMPREQSAATPTLLPEAPWIVNFSVYNELNHVHLCLGIFDEQLGGLLIPDVSDMQQHCTDEGLASKATGAFSE
jgi:hypothetical protein